MGLDNYSKRPPEMDNYLSHYGWHFSKKMCEFALSLMLHSDKHVNNITKEKVLELLSTYNVELNNNILYDAVYTTAMLKSDFLGTSILDERHLAIAVKDYLDDEDGYDTKAFSRWYIDTIKMNIPIDWDNML